jgi:hypothetical protein
MLQAVHPGMARKFTHGKYIRKNRRARLNRNPVYSAFIQNNGIVTPSVCSPEQKEAGSMQKVRGRSTTNRPGYSRIPFHIE